MGTSYHLCPETLLAVVDTGLAELVILPSAVASQEERPFQPPFRASAHGSLRSGVSRPERFPSGGFC